MLLLEEEALFPPPPEISRALGGLLSKWSCFLPERRVRTPDAGSSFSSSSFVEGGLSRAIKHGGTVEGLKHNRLWEKSHILLPIDGSHLAVLFVENAAVCADELVLRACVVPVPAL